MLRVALEIHWKQIVWWILYKRNCMSRCSRGTYRQHTGKSCWHLPIEGRCPPTAGGMVRGKRSVQRFVGIVIRCSEMDYWWSNGNHCFWLLFGMAATITKYFALAYWSGGCFAKSFIDTVRCVRRRRYCLCRKSYERRRYHNKDNMTKCYHNLEDYTCAIHAGELALHMNRHYAVVHEYIAKANKANRAIWKKLSRQCKELYCMKLHGTLKILKSNWRC